MKKTISNFFILPLLLLLSTLPTWAQHHIETDVQEAYFDDISVAKIKQVISGQPADTAYVFYMGFYGEKGQSSQHASVELPCEDHVWQLITDFDTLVGMKVKYNQRYVINRPHYKLTKHGNNNYMYIRAQGISRRVRLSKAQALVAWLNQANLYLLECEK